MSPNRVAVRLPSTFLRADHHSLISTSSFLGASSLSPLSVLIDYYSDDVANTSDNSDNSNNNNNHSRSYYSQPHPHPHPHRGAASHTSPTPTNVVTHPPDNVVTLSPLALGKSYSPQAYDAPPSAAVTLEQSSPICPAELLALPAIPASTTRTLSATRRLNVSTTTDAATFESYSTYYYNNSNSKSSSPKTTTNKMHFASAKTPTLTPLGQRLLALSRAKLHALDAPVGARDPADGLRRGVLVREAVRNAWASLDSPRAHSELTTWSAPPSDLGTLTEEDEDENDDDLDEVIAEERWLDNVLADVADDYDEPQTWAESTVGRPVYDDYEIDQIESYTFSATPAAMHLDDVTDVTVIAVSEYDDDDDIMVEDWLEVTDNHNRVHDQVDFAEDLEVVVAAEPMHVEPQQQQVGAVAHLDVESAFSSEVGGVPGHASLIASEEPDRSASPPISPESEQVVTPPPSVDDFAYALAALSVYALPPADLMPKLESRDTCDKLKLQVIPRRDVEANNTNAASPTVRPGLSRRSSCVFSDVESDSDQDSRTGHCQCDDLGLVCDGDCVPPALSPDDEDEAVDECRTPPFAPTDCEAFEELAEGLATFDWHSPKLKQRLGKGRSDRDWQLNALALALDV